MTLRGLKSSRLYACPSLSNGSGDSTLFLSGSATILNGNDKAWVGRWYYIFVTDIDFAHMLERIHFATELLCRMRICVHVLVVGKLWRWNRICIHPIRRVLCKKRTNDSIALRRFFLHQQRHHPHNHSSRTLRHSWKMNWEGDVTLNPIWASSLLEHTYCEYKFIDRTVGRLFKHIYRIDGWIVLFSIGVQDLLYTNITPPLNPMFSSCNWQMLAKEVTRTNRHCYITRKVMTVKYIPVAVAVYALGIEQKDFASSGGGTDWLRKFLGGSVYSFISGYRNKFTWSSDQLHCSTQEALRSLLRCQNCNKSSHDYPNYLYTHRMSVFWTLLTMLHNLIEGIFLNNLIK